MFQHQYLYDDTARNFHLKPISAGFVVIDGGIAFANGQSISLNLKSRPEIDSKIINSYLKV